MFWFTHWKKSIIEDSLKTAVFWKFGKTCRNISMT